jgi:hypothetical protein
VRAPSASIAPPAPARTAPRPAMSTGRCAPASRSAAAATAAWAGRGGAGSGGRAAGAPSASAAGRAQRSIGIMSTTGRRSTIARRSARAASCPAVSGEWTRSAAAPTDSTSACWSIRKFERRAAAGVSPARTSSGVEAFTASARPVRVFVRPGPWWTLQTPTRSVTRPQPSAMHTAPPSWRAAWKAAPSARSAFVTTKFPLPVTPKTVSTPSRPSAAPTLSATWAGMPRSGGRGKVRVCYTAQWGPMQSDHVRTRLPR